MKVFLIGATGGIEHRLVPMLHANSHEIIGLHRKPEQAEAIAQAGATPVLGGIIDMDATTLLRSPETRALSSLRREPPAAALTGRPQSMATGRSRRSRPRESWVCRISISFLRSRKPDAKGNVMTDSNTTCRKRSARILIERPQIRREVLELTDGSIPVTDAVNRLVRV